MTTFLARCGAKYIVALGAAGLMTSTPGHAVIPHDLAAGVETLAPVAKPNLAPVEAIAPVEPESALEHLADGEASYYGRELAGNRTASGERFNPGGLTAAHRTLPLGTKLKVTNKSNGKSVVVRINDRGPFIKKRLIDVSLGAAQQIGMISAGHAMVRLELLR
jgi:rare lipoprotein A